jgi:plasmid stabilization system protein ParE
LAEIYGFIAQDSLIFAEETLNRLTRRSEQIALFPFSGRVLPQYEAWGVREIIEQPYRVLYVVGGEIDILAVLHGRQNLPPALPGLIQ